jgi:hypothetical protein
VRGVPHLNREGNVDKLEQIAGRVARIVGPEQSPEQILESASLLAELAREWESEVAQGDASASSETPEEPVLATGHDD